MEITGEDVQRFKASIADRNNKPINCILTTLSTFMTCAAQFGVITAVILPLLPDEAYGPFEAFNPREIWLMVVLVSAVGLAGFVVTLHLHRALGWIWARLAEWLALRTLALSCRVGQLGRQPTAG